MKMMKRAAVAVSLVAAGGLLAGCAAGSPSGNGDGDAAESMTIRVSHVEPSDSITHKALEEVAERVSERTDGNLVLEIYPDGQLGTTTDILEQSASGETIIGYVDAASLAALGAKQMDILGGPFLFESTEQAQTFHESDMFAGMVDELAENADVRVLALNYFLGTRNILGADGYPEPSDLEGVKLRTPPIETWTRTFELVGAVPTTVEYTEAYSALEQGVVSAAESDINSFPSTKWYEAVKHLTLTHHFQLFLGFAMNEQAFQDLSDEYRQVLIEEFSQGGIDSTQVNIDNEAASIALLEENGVTVHEANLAAYRDATAPFYDGYEAGFLEKVREAAGMK
ncbi:TRAP transporter substrate-binding protein DctP [Ruicaihuangia caeni]|uniref:TRAP transporter substrate-binding protein DctP n=1 Tax=Ruicaihuangia caeni TaxID=3042517 RepID=A0AAW6T4X6_9MICO|nr:TRAP transporter substrate-binding protein DctP [Klugiella sp. YN-L-19]MDI2098782.1 TRAP transporter substrate-binding protein DctP [Klugiella sp. YN-L-19]